jgi:Ca-activated chloride channel family protein
MHRQWGQLRHPAFPVLLMLLFLLTGCGGGSPPAAIPTTSSLPAYMRPGYETYHETGGVPRPANAVDVYIVYSPESQQYMPRIIAAFNALSAAGTNPATGQPYTAGQPPVFVHGQQPTRGSSGTVAQGIINAFIAPNNENVYHPTIYQPSVSHWLALVNYQTGRTVFDIAQARPTALTPVVIGIWARHAQAIRDRIGRDTIGWSDLLDVLNSPNGWCDYGLADCRRAVFYGHTDPTVSSTGLSATIMEFYACAREHGFTERRLTAAAVASPDVQTCVRGIEELIKHYSRRTEDFLQYISRGPDYLDMLALEETDLICLNRGAQQGDQVCNRPQEPLEAIYPEEGTFWHEHPFAVLNADWVTPEQRAAAAIFTEYVLLEESQRIIMSEGFRPANPDVPLEFPLVEENGIDPAQPYTVLDVPAPEVIAAIQQSWNVVKKQADILLLIDVSGSMRDENKIDQAIAAAQAFVNNLDAGTNIGLTVFSSTYRPLIPLRNLETVRESLVSNIRSLRAEGGTELYLAVAQAVQEMNQIDAGNRIRAVVLLSDGADTGSQGYTLQNAIDAINASRDSQNPVLVIPVAYGSDADINALNALARASATSVQAGDPDNIQRVLDIISSFF